MGAIPKFSAIRAEKYLANQRRSIFQVNLTDPDEISRFEQLFMDQFGTVERAKPPFDVADRDRWRATVITDDGTTFADLLILSDHIHLGGDLHPAHWAPDPDGRVWKLLQGKLLH